MRIGPLVRLGKTLLTDEKFPDPVVPADLARTKAVHADADGNVPCIYCGARVPITQASMIGSDGYSCASCSARANAAAAAQMPAEGSLRSFPWLLVAIVIVLIVATILVVAGA
jgi:hypothetical protein